MNNGKINLSHTGKIVAGMSVALAIIVCGMSYLMQRYGMAELEENYIFLFDGDYIVKTVGKCGGLALLIGSFVTQFMQWLWVGPVCFGIICGLIVVGLTKTMTRLRPQPWTLSLVVFPVVFLWLCLENNSFKFQGGVALCITMLTLWGYTEVADKTKGVWSAVTALALTVFLYWTAGSVAILFVLGVIITELPKGWKRTAYNVGLLGVYCGCAFVGYATDGVPTIVRAFTPGMYYEWDTTWYMLLYAWIAVAVYMVMAYMFKDAKSSELRGKQLVAFALIVVAAFGLGARFYVLVHSASVQRSMEQRYHAKKGDWNAILAMDYGNEKTAFTSYRFLALAQKGMLADNLKSLQPYIGYFMENKTLVKKEDLEVVSDIMYECRSMGEVRRYAFDTNMVTPGAFNPVETLKLAEINIAYGDYKVAEKLIKNLEKTLMYAEKAKELRKFLYNDTEVKNDEKLGGMRSAIPKENSYMSPKGTGRDLQYAADANPDNVAAREFYRTFNILTIGHE